MIGFATDVRQRFGADATEWCWRSAPRRIPALFSRSLGMLHHVSFNARDPERAAHVMAALMDAIAVRLPAPPFPKGAWSVVSGDSQGSMIELIPWGHVLDGDARGGVTL